MIIRKTLTGLISAHDPRAQRLPRLAEAPDLGQEDRTGRADRRVLRAESL